MKYKAHAYQEYSTNWIIDHTASGLLLDMGMGKTVSTLTAVWQLLFDYFDSVKVLVIAPKRVAEDTWSREAEKWDHTKNLRVAKVLGNLQHRIQALAEPADIYVTNRENVVWLVDHYKTKWPFDTVVIDELSSFKSSKAKRFRALKKVRPLIHRIIGLTGTPAPNSLLDLWPQIYLLDGGERLGKTVTAYRQKYFEPDKRSQHIVFSWRLKPGAEQQIYSAISDICVSMKASDYLQLPKRVDNVVELELNKSEQKRYKQLERDLLLPFANGDIVANTAAVLSNKLLQYANGAIYNENGEVQELHSVKLDALEQIVEEANGQPILVFYQYKHDLERIKARFKQARELENSQTIANWNAGKIEMLLVHPASAGHGLNMQDGGHIIVWFSMLWSLEQYLQANARLDRQGQKESVIVHHLVAKGTIDEQALNVLQQKAGGQEALLEAVKARLKEVAKHDD
ncbi:DEAD/DEAH box helicase [Sporolactobacillus shoreicorticis]|uniref:SNF2-related protein n=1 Tax=Sporolactobacillus shoreicorticis TaxID=1923877 RepID=A0ABW5RZF3_9BACL|nr:DEAD/DEAH box helicase [Sporolactobacillus shoreicorticis]MCO7125098.1 DEAD/DEAH box helicase [Sporolactobacillus shoreicorticis]